MVVINYKRLISNLFILNVVLIRLSQSQTEANNLINNNSTVYEIEPIGSYVKESELNNMLFDIVLSNSIDSFNNNKSLYNYCDKQNYLMDLNYNFLPGVLNYFYMDANTTLIVFNIISITDLSFKVSIYTNNTSLINQISNNQLYFGFDFNSTNMLETLTVLNTTVTLDNSTEIVLEEFKDLYVRPEKSDIVICNLGLNTGQCNDFYSSYDTNTNQNIYYKNDNKLINNVLFPFGFEESKRVYLLKEEKVEGYLYYYTFSNSKPFNENTKNKTLVEFIHGKKNNTRINFFIGQGTYSNMVYPNSFVKYFNYKFQDGAGLNKSLRLQLNLVFIIVFFVLVFN